MNTQKLCLLLFTAIMFASCSNDSQYKEPTSQIDTEEFTSNTIENARLDQQLEYKKTHLKKLGNWLTKNLTQVRELVNENNINDSDYFTISINYLVNNIENTIDPQLQKSMDAFLNIEGKNWYPTVTFINSDLSFIQARTGEDQNDKPIIALEKIVNEEQTYEGYEQNELDELELIHEELEEDLHSNREIMLVDISGCGEEGIAGPDAFVNCDDVYADGSEGSGGTGNGNTSSTARIRINKMTVKHHKEGWPGRSEVNFIGFKTAGLPITSGYCGQNIAGSLNCYNPDGKRIDRFKRSWIGDERTMNYLVKEDPSYANPDEYLFFTIFEQDSWPAPKKSNTYNFPNNQYRILEYRSWQGDYDSQLLSQNYTNPYNIPFTNDFSNENGGIKYNLTRGQ
nr:hypothetical protein [uncultured Psychroserpens sp.]